MSLEALQKVTDAEQAAQARKTEAAAAAKKLTSDAQRAGEASWRRPAARPRRATGPFCSRRNSGPRLPPNSCWSRQKARRTPCAKPLRANWMPQRISSSEGL